MCCSAVERDLGSRLAAKGCRASDFQAAFAGGVGAQNPDFEAVDGGIGSGDGFESGRSARLLRAQGPARLEGASHIDMRRAAQQLANLALSGACGGLLVVGVLCRCPAGCGQRACIDQHAWAASGLGASAAVGAMRAQAWPAGPTAAWPDEGPTTSPPRSAWEATPEAADHPTPLTSPVASTPSSASPSRRSSSSLASEARLASMAARAAHLMDDVDRLRASNLEVPRLRRECEELRAAAARADGAEAAAAELSARLGAEAAARGRRAGRRARRTSALESDLAAARKALDVLAAERDALRPPETPLERFYDARTAAAVVSPSLRRPKLVASATETLLDLPSARRPRLADSASVAPDDRAVEVALLRANLQALRLEAEQLRRAAAAREVPPPPVPPPPPAQPEIAPPPPAEPVIAPPPPAEPEPVEAPATPPDSPRAQWAVELVGRDDAERFKLGRDGLPATSRRAVVCCASDAAWPSTPTAGRLRPRSAT